MCNDVKELTKFSELRKRQQEQYDERSREMLSGIILRLDGKYVHPKCMEWYRRVCYAHVPTYFKALLIDASFGTSATSTGFSRAGYELARHVHEYVEKEVMDELLDFVCKTADQSLVYDFVTKWSQKNANHCFRLVPLRKLETFIKGYIEYLHDTM